MSVLSWLSGKPSKLEQERRQLKEDLTQSIMKFERRRGEVEQVADDVMKLMHRRADQDPAQQWPIIERDVGMTQIRACDLQGEGERVNSQKRRSSEISVERIGQ